MGPQSYAVDFWACFLHQASQDVYVCLSSGYELCKSIVDCKMDVWLQELKDLVKRLLVHNPAHRLGALKGGAADVKAHPWFKDFDWEAFSSRGIKAPFVPKVHFFYQFCLRSMLHTATTPCQGLSDDALHSQQYASAPGSLLL